MMYTWLKYSNSLRTSERKLKFHQEIFKPYVAGNEKTEATKEKESKE
jgi:hypothetical protein